MTAGTGKTLALPSLAMQAADAVKWEDWEKWAGKSLEEFAAEVIKLSDAERGKEAVAWLNAAGDMSYIYGPYNPTDRPLFLAAPTIPEGMALVNAKKLNEFRNALETGLAWVVIPEGNCSCHLSPPCNNCIERSSVENDEQEIIGACKQIASMLAAAQGERNAD